MVRYLCQSCNSTYINNHVCFFYKKSGNLYSLDDQNETDEKDAKIDTASDDSDDKLYPAIEPKKAEQSNYLLVKNKEQSSFIPASKGDRPFFSFPDKTSHHGNGFYDSVRSTLNDQTNEESYFQSSLETFVSRSGFLGAAAEKPSTIVSLPGETEQSILVQETFGEEHGMLKDESKIHSFDEDKKIVKKSSNSPLKSTNNPQCILLESNDVSVTGVQQRNGESGSVSVDLPNTPKLPSVTSRAVTRSMTIKRKELVVPVEVEYAVAGHSKIDSLPLPEENGPFACQETFPSEPKLKKHFRTDNKPFNCDRCDMEFADKVTLDIHYRKHTGETPFKCDKCERAFAHKRNLYNHFRRHSGQKSFVCDVCKKLFGYKTALEVHVRTHTGEKPYKCEICEKAFAQRGNRTTHYKFIHNLICK